MSEKRVRKRYAKKVYSRIERPQRERRTTKSLELYQDESVSWNTRDKEKLLEALYRHSPLAVESISNVIGSKTPKEVEDFIEKTVDSACLDMQRRKVEVDPEKGAAPLELWLSLVQELVYRDKKVDHSIQFSKALRVIARNEPMAEDSDLPSLNWRNLYHFICDLLDDKVIVQNLSNMESVVMLDMMHSLGDTLHTSDMQEQRRILDLKYQLFNWEKANPSETFRAGLKAHLNDFTGLTTSNTTLASTSSMDSPASMLSNIQLVPSDQIPGPSHSSGLHLQSPVPSMSSSYHNLITSTDDLGASSISLQIHDQIHDPVTANNTSSVSITASADPQGALTSLKADPQVSLTSLKVDPQVTLTSLKVDPQNQTQTSEMISVPVSDTSMIESVKPGFSTSTAEKISCESGLNESDTNRSCAPEDEKSVVFTLPQMFSLNPLTIPPHLLEPKPKCRNIDDEIPVVINFKDS